MILMQLAKMVHGAKARDDQLWGHEVTRGWS